MGMFISEEGSLDYKDLTPMVLEEDLQNDL